MKTGTRRNYGGVLLALALTVGVWGCSSSTLPGRIELNRAMQRWQETGPSSYQVEMRVSCFCLPVLNSWSRVTIADGEVIGVVPVGEGEPVDSLLWDAWPTVPELFERIRDGVDGELIIRVDVEYHPELGYPTYANFIESPNVADAGVSYSLRELTTRTN